MKSNNILSKNKTELLTLSNTELNTILDRITDGETAYELAKDLRINLKTLYSYLDLNPKFKEKFDKAQEHGIKTLVEKMLVLFNTDNPEVDPNTLLFIRERSSFLKWLAPRVSSLFQEKQKLDIKSDSKINISWSDNNSELIDVSADVVENSNDKSNP
jgi:hypothetical protein